MQVFRPSVVVDPNDSREITDQDIQKAFRSKPQLRLPATVAFFEMGPEDKALPGRISKLTGITKIYQIPSLLVTGPRHGDRYDRRYGSGSQKVVSLKKLRLLAARGRADLLVLSSTTLRHDLTPNWMVSFSLLLVTSLFLPMYHVEVGYQQEVLVIDVRNGFLYKQIKVRQKARKRYVQTLALGKACKRLERTLRKKVRKQTVQELRALLVPKSTRALARR